MSNTEQEYESSYTDILDTKQQPLKGIIKRQKITMIVCIITLILVLLSNIMFAMFNVFKVITKQVGLVVEVDVPTIGVEIPDYDPIAVITPDEDITGELNEKLDRGKMCINMVSAVTLQDAYASGCFNIINSETNNYPQFVTIVLDSNNATIYQSGLVGVGKCIPYDTLDVALPKGTYECTAIFQQVDPATKSICGKAAAKITITIQN